MSVWFGVGRFPLLHLTTYTTSPPSSLIVRSAGLKIATTTTNNPVLAQMWLQYINYSQAGALIQSLAFDMLSKILIHCTSVCITRTDITVDFWPKILALK